MKLTFIGTGSAFTVGGDNFHSNMILESNTHEKMLIDCGSDAAWHFMNSIYLIGILMPSTLAIFMPTIAEAWNGWHSVPNLIQNAPNPNYFYIQI